MNYEYIDTPQALHDFCERISGATALAIDTEFVRTRTLVPQLGLIQVYDGHSLGLIDPVAISDLSVFADILVDPSVVKVLHSCSEDIDAIWYNLGVTPAPLFDTQFAANLVGMGQSLGYAAIVENMLGTVVDKGESRTDWIARPLSPEQLHYAAADVYYLLPVYEALLAKVQALGQHAWVAEEFAFLAHKKRTDLPSDLAYINIKNSWKLRGSSLQALKLLAAWRLEQARERDMAINFVLREQAMLEAAMILPDSKAKVFQLPSITPKEARVHGEVIADLVTQSKTLALENCPQRVQRLVDFKLYKPALAKLKLVCEDIAKQHNTRVEVLASKKQMSQVLKWCWFDFDELEPMQLKPDLLSAWRRELFLPALTELFAKEGSEYDSVRSL